MFTCLWLLSLNISHLYCQQTVFIINNKKTKTIINCDITDSLSTLLNEIPYYKRRKNTFWSVDLAGDIGPMRKFPLKIQELILFVAPPRNIEILNYIFSPCLTTKIPISIIVPMHVCLRIYDCYLRKKMLLHTNNIQQSRRNI